MQLVKLQQERDNYSAQIAALNLQGVPVAQLIGNNVPPIEGKVSEVAADGSFVVLSVGENEGVKIGFTFDVYRGSDYIGRVVVNNVLPDSSTARVQMRNRGGLKFQSMDTATTRL